MSHKPKTVLIVDDDEGMRDTLTAILKREYRVLRVSSGEAALPILNREDVDLMMLDVRLPASAASRSSHRQGELQPGRSPDDLGHQRDRDRVQAMKHGAYHYVTKDFDYDQLRRSCATRASARI
jgi:Response regulator containing CheY-like receiver, AAA-type ATPase, and DNA-binding domains